MLKMNSIRGFRLTRMTAAISAVVTLTLSEAFGQSVANYSVSRTTGITYTSIAGTGTSVTSWRNTGGGYVVDDNRSYPQPVGFDFWYNGVRYTTFNVSTNGFVDFSGSTDDGGPQADDYGYQNTAFSQTNINNATWLAIAPIYDDQTTQGASDPLGEGVKYKVTGSAPNRVLTIEWIDMAIYGNSAPSLNYQVKLYESSGIIEFVYGTMDVGTGWTPSYTVGINDSTLTGAPPAAADLLTQQTANSATFGNTPVNNLTTLPASNTKLTFTPPSPSAPTSLTFSLVTSASMQLNWTDNATNEIGYVIYRSSDGANYTFMRQISAGSTSSAESGLLANTTYYWRVYAVTEGNTGSALSGSQATDPAASYISASTGSWNTGSTWVGGAIPAANADVTIADGHTVTLDTSPVVNNLTVGEGTSGRLMIGDDATARTLTVNGDLTIETGATLDVNTGFAQTGHNLVLGGDLVNDGTFDLAPGATSRASASFTKDAGTQTVRGGGILTNFYLMSVDVGSSTADMLDVYPENFSTAASGFLTLTNGTFRFSCPDTIQPFAGAATIGSTAGLWLNDDSAVVTVTANLTVSGLLEVSSGRLDIGSASNTRLIYSGGEIVIEGGLVNIAGRLDGENVTTIIDFRMSGGELRVPTVGSTSTTSPPFNIDVPGSSFEWTGGRIVIEREGGSGFQNLGYENTGASVYTITGGTLQIGSSVTPAGQTMIVDSDIPVYDLIDSSANATIQVATNDLDVNGDVNIVAGTLNANGFGILLAGNWTSAGTFTAGTGTVTFDGAGAQTMSVAGGETFYNLTIDKSSGQVTFSSDAAVNGAFSVVGGSLDIGTQTLTLNGSASNGGTISTATTGTIVYGQTSAGQTILPLDYGNLTLSAFSKTFPSGTIRIAGSLTVPNPATAHVIAGNTVEYNGGAQTVSATTANFSYNNLVLGGSGTKTAGGAVAVGGSLTVSNGLTFSLGASTTTVAGDVVNDGAISATSGDLLLSGGTVPHGISGSGSIDRLTLNDANGGTLSDNLTIATLLTLTNGILSSGSDTVIIGSSGSVSRASGHIDGLLRQTVPAGSPTVSFDVGDASNYAPVSLTFSSVSVSGSMTVQSVAAEHSDIANSPVEPTNSVNRYWTIATTGISFVSASATFTYVASDVDQPGGELSFIVGKYDAGVWTQPTVGTRTGSSAEATGLTSFSEFVVGGTATAGAYRSFQSGNWNVTSTWERFDGVSWINPAPATPTNGNSNSIRVLSGHTVTVTAGVTIDQAIVEAGGQVNVNSGAITLAVANGTGTDLTVNGTLQTSSNNNITTTGLVEFGSGSLYIHNRNGGNIPTATWDAASTCRITGTVGTAPGNLGQTFGNIEWNAPSQTVAANLNGVPSTINGNFTVDATGSGLVQFYDANPTTTKNIAGDLIVNGGTLRLKLGNNNTQMNVGGDLQVTGGTLVFTTGAGAMTLTVSGDIAVSGGTVQLSASAAANTLNAAGDVTLSSGIVTETSTGSGTIVFNGSSLQTYVGGATITNSVNFQVASAATVSLGTETVDGNGTFTLSAGGTIEIGSVDGITSAGATGNVQVTGARTFSTAGNYMYNGSAAQSSGNGLPATVNVLSVDNVSGVTLVSNVTVSDSVNLLAGDLAIGVNTLTIANVVSRVSGTLSSNQTGTVNYSRASNGQGVIPAAYGNLTFSDFTKSLSASDTIHISGSFTPGSATGHTTTNSTVRFNGASQTIPSFEYHNLITAGSGTSTLGGTTVVSGDLYLASGAFSDGGYSLIVQGDLANSVVHTGAGVIILDGSTSANALSGTGSYENLEIDNSAFGVTLQDNLTINGELLLTGGIITAASDTVVISTSGYVTRPPAGGHVDGYMKMTFGASASPQTLTFEVGDATTHAAVDLTLLSVSSSGSVTAQTSNGDHPSVLQSGLDEDRTANRTWNLSTGEGLAFSSANVTLNFQPSDLDAGATPTSFYGRRYSGGLWTAPSIGVRTSTSTQVLSITGLGEFVTGNLSTIFYWTGAGGTTSWKESQNWSGLAVPSNVNDVYFTTADTIDVDTSAYARRVFLQNDSVRVSILDGFYLHTEDSLQVQGGTLVIENQSLDSVAAVFFADGIVEYAGTGSAQRVRDTVYANLFFSGGASKALEGDVRVTDTLRISSDAIVSDSAFTLTANASIENDGVHTGQGSLVLSGGSVAHEISGGGQFGALQLNDANGVNLTGSFTFNDSLLLTTGNMNVAAGDTLRISSTGTLTRTAGHVVGRLQKFVPTGAQSVLFEVGTVTAYLPVRLQATSVTSGGYVAVARIGGEHPNISDASRVIPDTDNVNVWWQLLNNGTVFGSGFDLVLSFVNPAELDANVDPTGVRMGAQRWSGSSWNTETVGQTFADSTLISSFASFGDFVLGDLLSQLYSSAATGFWDSPATWSPNGIPGSMDSVRIASGHTVTLRQDEVIRTMDLQAGGVFSDSTFSLTATGYLILNGTLAGNGEIVWTSATDSVYGSCTVTGTSTLRADTTVNIASTALLELHRLLISSGDTVWNFGALTADSVSGSSSSSVFVNSSSSSLTVARDLMSTGSLAASSTGNTVTYNGTTAQTVKTTTYFNLSTANTGVKSVVGSITVDGNLAIGSGSTLSIPSGIVVTVRGAMTTAGQLANDGQVVIEN